uniref:Immediate-early protein 1 n=1 Tax=Murid herpesvirus 1 TaxID=10366 RepID=Q69183_MUHV1|nr:immediate-early protein 1 [Murid betaherpesvirus 1]WEG71773.1 regulatory protein IE1 [Murid betaherpesvirus 1]DBA07639.1 TPA_asm: m123 [Murid betaherpesvirus 1]DBA08093.1 TPA_asm: m123 [Murid betaherpesvirus 1]
MEPAAPSCNMIMIADQASVNAHGRHLDENRVYPSDKVPAHVANKILESGTETVRCDLTLEDMLGDYEYDDPTEEEKILMDRIADHVGNDNSDMAIKHAAVRSVLLSCKIAHLMIKQNYQSAINSATNILCQLANDIFERIERQRKMIYGCFRSEFDNVQLGRLMYDMYPHFMPTNLGPSEKRVWMSYVGEAIVAATNIDHALDERAAWAKTDCSLPGEFKSEMCVLVGAIRRLHDPPCYTKPFLDARSQLAVWQQMKAIESESVSTHVVVVEALKLRENLAKAVQETIAYERHQYHRVCQMMCNNMKDHLETTCMLARGRTLATLADLRSTRYNLALFLLSEMHIFDSFTMPRIRGAMKQARCMSYVERTISLAKFRELADRVHNRSAPSPQGVIEEQQQAGEEEQQQQQEIEYDPEMPPLEREEEQEDEQVEEEPPADEEEGGAVGGVTQEEPAGEATEEAEEDESQPGPSDNQVVPESSETPTPAEDEETQSADEGESQELEGSQQLILSRPAAPLTDSETDSDSEDDDEVTRIPVGFSLMTSPVLQPTTRSATAAASSGTAPRPALKRQYAMVHTRSKSSENQQQPKKKSKK